MFKSEVHHENNNIGLHFVKQYQVRNMESFPPAAHMINRQLNSLMMGLPKLNLHFVFLWVLTDNVIVGHF